MRIKITETPESTFTVRYKRHWWSRWQYITTDSENPTPKQFPSIAAVIQDAIRVLKIKH